VLVAALLAVLAGLLAVLVAGLLAVLAGLLVLAVLVAGLLAVGVLVAGLLAVVARLLAVGVLALTVLLPPPRLLPPAPLPPLRLSPPAPPSSAALGWDTSRARIAASSEIFMPDVAVLTTVLLDRSCQASKDSGAPGGGIPRHRGGQTGQRARRKFQDVPGGGELAELGAA
jgi:hypothetical protein